MVPRPVRAEISREWELKAAFLYKFTQFVDWPGEVFPATDSRFVIGVLGADPFGTVLDEAVRNETVRGRKLTVERYRRVEDVKACHILFISASEAPRLNRILATLKEQPILTVADFEGFTPKGGMIRFLTESNKTRLRINAGAAKDAKLTISSKLLRMAEIVETDK